MLAMSQFSHSIVLFTGDDGMPIEFNIQYCTDKQVLSEIIEYGGGLCTHTDNAIHLVTPGTKVLNISTTKKIVTSTYVYDCVRENYLLDLDDYKLEINEIETSDISEDFTLNVAEDEHIEDRRNSDASDNSVDITEVNQGITSPVMSMPAASNHAFDFEDTESRNSRIPEKETNHEHETSSSNIAYKKVKKNSDNDINEVPDSVDELNLSGNMEILDQTSAGPCDFTNMNNLQEKHVMDNSINAVIVSSSQPNNVDLDDFDNIILNKVKEKPEKQDDDDSQSYTVSSSADAQVSPKILPHNTSADIFSTGSAAADSASQTRERQLYINNLEKEIKEILKKPSPKSIQDKIVLVKYICCVKKLAPAIVLQILQKWESKFIE